MKRVALCALLLIACGLCSSCVLTKVVTVPMRVGAGVVSIVPVVGNTAHDAVDTAAEKVDDLPF